MPNEQIVAVICLPRPLLVVLLIKPLSPEVAKITEAINLVHMQLHYHLLIVLRLLFLILITKKISITVGGLFFFFKLYRY